MKGGGIYNRAGPIQPEMAGAYIQEENRRKNTDIQNRYLRRLLSPETDSRSDASISTNRFDAVSLDPVRHTAFLLLIGILVRT